MIAMVRIDRSITVAQLLDQHPAAMRPFIDWQMSCIGCPMAPYHTIEDVCREYDLPLDDFTQELAATVNPS
jgi:hybrid cluster-associated redox disulfide protein